MLRVNGRLEGSFENLLKGTDSRFQVHELRHAFTSWYMMSGGDLYELAKILGHSNIKATKRYAFSIGSISLGHCE